MDSIGVKVIFVERIGTLMDENLRKTYQIYLPVDQYELLKVKYDVYVCICLYMYVYVCIDLYMYVYVYICMDRFVYVCICLYMYV